MGTKVKDRLYQLPAGAVQIEGVFDELLRLITENTLKQLNYRVLADYFRNKLDPFATGEFWGKIVRAGSLTYKYNGDQELKKILDDTVDDMLSIQTPDGCISTVPYKFQPNGSQGSDLWERKYVLLGLESYYEISGREDVLESMMAMADYTIDQVGEPPKKPITETGWAFCGIESSSILEPIVKLYHLTGEQRYLDFASYIVNSGACSRENMFEQIYLGKDPMAIGDNGNPKESIAKAYEMMSCFEGLVEYYRATGEEKWKETALRFYQKLIEQEITLLGSGGADAPYNLGPGCGEQWNYTKKEQTNPDIDLMMETCVTVTWMKLCYQLLRLTGEPTIADEMERSAYNALIGAIRPDGKFFEYFPRFNGLRNPKVNYSFNIDGFDLSCCTANGPSGLALVPFTAFMQGLEGPVIQFYVSGEARFSLPKGGSVKVVTSTSYPVEGSFTAEIAEAAAEEEFTVSLRVPFWCPNFRVQVNGEVAAKGVPGSYAALKRCWKKGDCISVEMELPVRVFDAPHGANRSGDDFIAFMRGPILLARDARTGEAVSKPVSFEKVLPRPQGMLRYGTDCTDEISMELAAADFPCWIQTKVKTDDGEITLIDYRSAGATWKEDSEFYSWIPVKKKE